jgi:hypothetical protein
MRHPLRLILPVVFALAAACSDPNQLAPAGQKNFLDTLTLAALRGTPIQQPSAYAVADGLVRTDQTSNFDFAFDVDSASGQIKHYFLPQAVLDIRTTNSVNPGLQLRAEGFDQIKLAPSNGYITKDSLVADSGQVYIVRSRIVCNIGVSLYSKLQILSFDDSARTVTFKVLANTNCGYKSLQPGIPKQ